MKHMFRSIAILMMVAVAAFASSAQDEYAAGSVGYFSPAAATGAFDADSSSITLNGVSNFMSAVIDDTEAVSSTFYFLDTFAGSWTTAEELSVAALIVFTDADENLYAVNATVSAPAFEDGNLTFVVDDVEISGQDKDGADLKEPEMPAELLNVAVTFTFEADQLTAFAAAQQEFVNSTRNSTLGSTFPK